MTRIKLGFFFTTYVTKKSYCNFTDRGLKLKIGHDIIQSDKSEVSKLNGVKYIWKINLKQITIIILNILPYKRVYTLYEFGNMQPHRTFFNTIHS